MSDYADRIIREFWGWLTSCLVDEHVVTIYARDYRRCFLTARDVSAGCHRRGLHAYFSEYETVHVTTRVRLIEVGALLALIGVKKSSEERPTLVRTI